MIILVSEKPTKYSQVHYSHICPIQEGCYPYPTLALLLATLFIGSVYSSHYQVFLFSFSCFMLRLNDK